MSEREEGSGVSVDLRARRGDGGVLERNNAQDFDGAKGSACQV